MAARAAIRDVGRALNVPLPDVDRLSLTSYVSEGFNVPVAQLGINFLLLVVLMLVRPNGIFVRRSATAVRA